MIEEIFGAIFHGIWLLIKLLAKLLYKFLKHHPRYACLLPIILFAGYFRITYIVSSIGFLGIDPGDIRLVESLFKGNLILTGSLLSPAHVTLGPFYDYLIAPPLWIMGANPLGPAIVSGIAYIATIYLLYVVGKQFFNLQAGLFAAGLYAASPFVTSYVHLSWNIDLLPLFSLLLLWVIFNAAASARPFVYYLLAGYLLGLCLQLHYSAIFLVIVVLLYMLITEIIVKGKKFVLSFFIHFVELLSGFVFCLLPFLYEEALKGFVNTKTFWNYFLNEFSSSHLILSIPQTFFVFFERLVVNYPSPDTIMYYAPVETAVIRYSALVLLVVSFTTLFLARNRFVILVLILWLLSGAFSLSLFQNSIYDYHFSLLYTVCFLLIGNFLATIFHFADQERVKMAKQLISQTAEQETYTMIPVDVTDKKKLILHILSIGISVIIFFLIVLLGVSILPYRHLSKEKVTQINDVAKFIIGKADKKPFNFALLATPYTDAYPNVYVNDMKKLGNEPVQIQHTEIDPDKKTVTDTLFVVCEYQNCKPLKSQNWNIQGFENAAVWDHWSVQGTTVYKLVHVVIRTY